MKRLLAILVSMVLLLAVFAGCAPSATSGTSEPAASNGSSVAAGADIGPYNFAFIMYNWEDNQGLYLKSYCAYLEENFNVTFEFVTAGPDADTVISAVESLCTKGGVDGIFNSMTAGFQSWADICKEYEVYFTVPLNVVDEDDREYAASNPYFVGSAATADFTDTAKEYAELLIERGYKSFLVTGFVPGILNQCQQTIAGITEVVEKYAEQDPEYKIEVLTTPPTDQFEAITAALSDTTKDYDLLFTTVNTMDFGVNNVYLTESVGRIMVAGNNASETSGEAFAAGVLDSVSDNLTASVGFNFALMINALQGNVLPGTPEGYLNLAAPALFIGDLATFELYQQYVMSPDLDVHAVMAEDIVQFIVSQNANATWAELEQYVKDSSIETIVARHS